MPACLRQVLAVVDHLYKEAAKTMNRDSLWMSFAAMEAIEQREIERYAEQIRLLNPNLTEKRIIVSTPSGRENPYSRMKDAAP